VHALDSYGRELGFDVHITVPGERFARLAGADAGLVDKLFSERGGQPMTSLSQRSVTPRHVTPPCAHSVLPMLFPRQKLATVTNRDVERAVGSRVVKLDNWNIQRLFEQLHSLGWLIRVEQRRRNDPEHGSSTRLSTRCSRSGRKPSQPVARPVERRS
jgi:hypothetical protein